MIYYINIFVSTIALDLLITFLIRRVFKLDATKFETNLTAEERMESIKKISIDNNCKNIDFVTVIKAPYFASVQLSCECTSCK